MRPKEISKETRTSPRFSKRKSPSGKQRTPRRLFTQNDESPTTSLVTSPSTSAGSPPAVNSPSDDHMKKVMMDAFAEYFGGTPKQNSPQKLSKEERRQYKNDIHQAVKSAEEQERGFRLQARFDSNQNRAVCSEVVRTLNNTYSSRPDTRVVNKMLRRYFHTKKRMMRLEEQEKKEEFLRMQRRRQRMNNARLRRLRSLKISKISMFNNDETVRIMESLSIKDYVSSEDTATSSEDEEYPKMKTLKKKKLPWRTSFLNTAYKELDKVAFRARSTLVFKRKKGSFHSTRKPPCDAPSWAVQPMDV